MKVLHINTWSHGSTGNVALSLHRALKASGNDSAMLVADNRVQDDPTVILSKKPGPLALTAKRGIRRLSSDILWRGKTRDHVVDPVSNFAFPTPEEIESQLPFIPDLIVAYWVSFFLDDRRLRELSERFKAPLFWYLMDMAPITGGCHYAFDCPGYFDQCGKCPGIVSKREDDFTHARMVKKTRELAQTPVVFLAPSSQVIDQLAVGSVCRDRPHELLVYSVSPELFAPKSKADARKRFEVPEDAFIIFFGAQHLQEKRKGMAELLEALKQLFESLEPQERDKVFLLYAGSGANLELPFGGKFIGYLDRDGLAAAYQAANVYACPSIEESGPLMINESLMSGTPVVCFEMGVGRDLVHNGQTGFRVPLGDCEAFSNALLALVRQSPEDRVSLGKSCREYAENHLHPLVQAKRLVHLGEKHNYKKLTAGLEPDALLA